MNSVRSSTGNGVDEGGEEGQSSSQFPFQLQYDSSSADEFDQEDDNVTAQFDADQIRSRLDAELLELRELRDDELDGIRPSATNASADDDDHEVDEDKSDEEEFQTLLNYQPRCTFRPMSARGKARISNQHGGSTAPDSDSSVPFHETAGPSIAAFSSTVESVLLEADAIEWKIDGKSIDLAEHLSPRPHPSHSHSRSRPSTGSRQYKSSLTEEKIAPLSLRPSSPSTLSASEDDGTEKFITAIQHDVNELRSLISAAPEPSPAQRQLIDSGVGDISAWARSRREELTEQTRVEQKRLVMEQEERRKKMQEDGVRTTSDANNDAHMSPPSFDQSTNHTSSSASDPSAPPSLPPLIHSLVSPTGASSSSSTADPTLPVLSAPSVLPPLLPTAIARAPSSSTLSASTSGGIFNANGSLQSEYPSLARSMAREEAFKSFLDDERAKELHRSQLIESTLQERKDQQAKESAYLQVSLKRLAQKEEQRLRAIKQRKLDRERELLERERERQSTQRRIEERQQMRNEDRRANQIRATQLKRQRDQARRLALEALAREHAGMKLEDERSTVHYRKRQAILAEERARQEADRLAKARREEAERLERDRLEQIRLDMLRKKAEEEKRLQEEYAARKREEARREAEAEAERVRIAAEKEAQRQQYEAEVLRAREELIRKKLEEERIEAERRRAAELERQRLEAEEEARRQELIAKELARREAEEEERRQYFEKLRLEKEEAARREQERIEREQREAEEKRREEERLAHEALKKRQAEEKSLRRATRAAWRIQRVWRGYHARAHDTTARAVQHRLNQRKAHRYRAAQKIQALVRGYLLRRRLEHIRQQAKRELDKLNDEDDEFDYGGLDPKYYMIDQIPEFDMQLPEEAKRLLKVASEAPPIDVYGRSGSSKDRQDGRAHATPSSSQSHPRSLNDRVGSSSSSSSTDPAAPSTVADRTRVHSAGVASKLSASGRGGLVTSSAIAMEPTQHINARDQMRVNNFFGGSLNGNVNSANSPSISIPSHVEPTPTKFPRLGTPSSSGSASPSPPSSAYPQSRNITTAVSDAGSDISHRSADHSSRPEGPSTHGSSSKANKLAELSAAWGVTDPRTLEAMLRKKQKMARMKGAKKAANMSADERLEKFQRVTGGSANHSTSGVSHSAVSGISGGNFHGEKKKKPKLKGPPAAWFGPPKGQSHQQDFNGEEEFDDHEDIGDVGVDDMSITSASGHLPYQPVISSIQAKLPLTSLQSTLSSSSLVSHHISTTPFSPTPSISNSSHSVPPSLPPGLNAPSWLINPSKQIATNNKYR